MYAPVYVVIHMQMGVPLPLQGQGFYFSDHVMVDLCICTRPSLKQTDAIGLTNTRDVELNESFQSFFNPKCRQLVAASQI